MKTVICDLVNGHSGQNDTNKKICCGKEEEEEEKEKLLVRLLVKLLLLQVKVANYLKCYKPYTLTCLIEW